MFAYGQDTLPHFGTKTSYLVNGNMNIDYPLPTECTPVYLWGMLRHGTRNPGEEDIIIMADRLDEIKDRILDSWLDNTCHLDDDTIVYLDQWKFTLTVDDESKLAEAGKYEHEEMGSRWRTRLHDFISKEKTEVRTSHKSRCRHSSDAFTTGLFGEELEFYIDDSVARFYDDCPEFLENVEENDETYREAEKLEESEHFASIYKDVENTLGLNLAEKDITAIWDICRYETAWNKGIYSPWCNVFSMESISILEYREDLNYYYSEGYGFNVTLDMTQPLWSDLLTRLEEVKQHPTSITNSTVLLFTHSTATFPFMASLGLYKDESPITAADWPANTLNRKWKTSKIASFATNLMFIVGDCGTSANDDLKYNHESVDDLEEVFINQLESESEGERLKLFLFHQEHPIPLPNDIQYLDEFIDNYMHKSNVDFEQVCELKNDKN